MSHQCRQPLTLNVGHLIDSSNIHCWFNYLYRFALVIGKLGCTSYQTSSFLNNLSSFNTFLSCPCSVWLVLFWAAKHTPKVCNRSFTSISSYAFVSQLSCDCNHIHYPRLGTFKSECNQSPLVWFFQWFSGSICFTICSTNRWLWFGWCMSVALPNPVIKQEVL